MINSFVPITRNGVHKKQKDELTDLVYDRVTRVVYFAVYVGRKCISRHPYISANGKYCRFIDEKIVEIES